MPILTLMVEMVQANRTIRKFVRLRVLPPLRDVTKRPEEGRTLRNKLCTLMTSPLHDVKHLSANFLFILCKESVDRLIKYTGYGNAAGLLASRGLMLGGNKPTIDYSSGSEDSDTEEYVRVRDMVNPVTGRYEPPRPSPLEGMTDEQKEHEAMKLVNVLDKLTRNNVIQPCRIGNDGKPHPVESVMELQEGMGVMNPQDCSDHSDSDYSF
ncbi:Synembryn-A [Portunus trituberculatus]|uniref:Synembryn-A n=1 Tax=Portunus trituberculatus TaxID=210409 RepID=A0A5B7CL59_PORTR|nr:Synembryn-A [Portunus trituberculatus]